MCPKQAKIPIKQSHDHCIKVGLTQTEGTIKEEIMVPTMPLINNVNNGLSVECNFLVIIK